MNDDKPCIYGNNNYDVNNCIANCDDEICKYKCKINQRNSLVNNIWITRKCRIYTAERLRITNIRIQLFLVIYSLYVVALSILNFIPHESININEDFLSGCLLIASIIITTFSIYITTQNYQERYVNLKNNYINLGKLSDDIKNIPAKELSIEQLKDIYEKYNYELLLVENHLDLDMALAKIYNIKKSKFENTILSFKYTVNYPFGEKNLSLTLFELILLIKYYLFIGMQWFVTIGIGVYLLFMFQQFIL